MDHRGQQEFGIHPPAAAPGGQGHGRIRVMIQQQQQEEEPIGGVPIIVRLGGSPPRLHDDGFAPFARARVALPFPAEVPHDLDDDDFNDDDNPVLANLNEAVNPFNAGHARARSHHLFMLHPAPPEDDLELFRGLIPLHLGENLVTDHEDSWSSSSLNTMHSNNALSETSGLQRNGHGDESMEFNY